MIELFFLSRLMIGFCYCEPQYSVFSGFLNLTITIFSLFSFISFSVNNQSTWRAAAIGTHSSIRYTRQRTESETMCIAAYTFGENIALSISIIE